MCLGSDMTRLTDKRKVFIEAYLTCFNASEAARQAGYKQPGVYGHHLKNLKIVRDEIARRLADMAMTADEVLFRLGEHARSDVALFVNEAGEIDISAVRDHGHLVKRYIRNKRTDSTTIELHDAQAALTLIGKHHALFTDRVEHAGEIRAVRAEDLTDDELAAIATGCRGGVAEKAPGT